MRRWRNLPFRRGQFQQVPPTAVVVVLPQIGHDSVRQLPFVRRGKITQPVLITVAVTPHPAPPPQLSHDAPRFLPLPRRSRISQPVKTQTVTVTVKVPAQLGHDPIRLPFLRRGKYQPTPVQVAVVVTAQPPVSRVQRRLRGIPLRSARGKFFPHELPGIPFSHPPICLGGSETEFVINGTAQVSAFNGTGTTLVYNGSAATLVYNGTGVVVDPGRNGTATILAYNGTFTIQLINGTETAWCMIAVNLTIGEFDDTSINLAFTQTGGSALDISSATIDVYLKTAAGVSDTDASTKHYSSGGVSPAITITNGPGGLATCQIPNTDIQNANLAFWKARVTIGGKQNTAMFGTVTTTLL